MYKIFVELLLEEERKTSKQTTPNHKRKQLLQKVQIKIDYSLTSASEDQAILNSVNNIIDYLYCLKFIKYLISSIDFQRNWRIAILSIIFPMQFLFLCRFLTILKNSVRNCFCNHTPSTI